MAAPTEILGFLDNRAATVRIIWSVSIRGWVITVNYYCYDFPGRALPQSFWHVPRQTHTAPFNSPEIQISRVSIYIISRAYTTTTTVEIALSKYFLTNASSRLLDRASWTVGEIFKYSSTWQARDCVVIVRDFRLAKKFRVTEKYREYFVRIHCVSTGRAPSWMCLGHKSWVAWLDIRGSEEARGRGRRKIEERRKKREKEGRRKGSTETVATRSFHGVRKDAATLSFPCSEDECKENARVWDGARTCARTHGTRGSYARGHRAHRFDRNRSSPVEARPVSARLLSLSREGRERVHQRTHTQAGTRAESRSQSPAVGGRFDVAAAASTFTTLNTFISRSRALPLRLPRFLHRVPTPPSRFLRLLCSCTTLSTSFRNSSRCPRGLNFTPCRDSWAWRHAWPAFSHDQFPLFPAFRFANKPRFLGNENYIFRWMDTQVLKKWDSKWNLDLLNLFFT